MGGRTATSTNFAPAMSGGAFRSRMADGPLDARKARLIDVLEDIGAKTLRYLYDFGDGWEHTVKVERLATRTRRRLSAPDRGHGRCPPEDSAAPGATPKSRRDPRPQARTPCRIEGVDRRRLRSERRGCRRARRRSCRAGETLVAKTYSQASAPYMIRGAGRRDTLVSRPAGVHRRPLAERCVRLSPHTAPIRQTRRSFRCASVRRDQRGSGPASRESGQPEPYAPESA